MLTMVFFLSGRNMSFFYRTMVLFADQHFSFFYEYGYYAFKNYQDFLVFWFCWLMDPLDPREFNLVVSHISLSSISIMEDKSLKTHGQRRLK